MVMKRGIMVAVAMMVCSIIFAQTGEKIHHKNRQGHAEKMKSVLSLSDTQVASIKEIDKKYNPKQHQLKRDSTSVDKKAQLKSVREQRQTEIDAVLTPEQKVKWDAYKKQNADRRKSERKEDKKKFRENMKTSLNLSDDQVLEIENVNKDFKQRRLALKSKDSKNVSQVEFEKLKTDRETAIKSILTEQQFAKWNELKREGKPKNRRHKK
jgi:hypothetical protein